MASDKDTLAEEVEAFELAYDHESENRAIALDDLKFARMSEQWPDVIRKKREEEGRPVLTINKMPAFIRQVVNDSRQNRPQIKVKPVDDKADPDTAKMLEGLVRNIEYESKADVAYDTAVDNACSMGWGYLRVAIEYEYEGSFDKCLKIQRVGNPFTVYGDPFSVEADSSDWNRAFVTEYLNKNDFERKYKGADKIDWKGSGYGELKLPWKEDEQVLIAESWQREIVKSSILMLSNGMVVDKKSYEAGADIFQASGLQVVNERTADMFKVTQRIMTGAEVLETNEWAGKYIPIIPVYGEEINVEGKRYFRSLIHNAKDAQRMFNYWRTQATELVALAPRAPYLGEEGSFDVDKGWATANTDSHPYLEYKKGMPPPQRQPMDTGRSVGAMSEAMAAGDDMKAIIGMYDASLGQKSNETSGKAIMARQREGDVSTFHFIDNLSRAIRHTGSVIIDLIPKTYSGQRMVRVLGEDGKETTAKIGEQQDPQQMQMQQQAHAQQQARVYDISTGRYDVAVTTGPGYTTRREEMAVQMTEFVRAFPAAAPVIGDLLVKALDWQNSEEIAERLKAMLPAQAQGGLPPELQEQIEGGKQHIQEQDQEIQKLNVDLITAKLDGQKKDIEIARLKAMADISGALNKIETAHQVEAAKQPSLQAG
jgi:hypothetical protein